MNRKNLLILAAASGLLVVVGCGPRSSVPPSFAPTGNPGTILQPLNSTTIPANVVNALMGSYGGTVRKEPLSGATQTQPYTFTLSQVADPAGSGQQITMMTFNSTGPIGAVAFEAQIKLWNTQSNGYDTDGQPLTAYSLDSSLVNAPALTDDPEVNAHIRLIISLKNQTTFVPTQSGIYFRDCVFTLSQPSCMAMLYVSSGNDLGKR